MDYLGDFNVTANGSWCPVLNLPTTADADGKFRADWPKVDDHLSKKGVVQFRLKRGITGPTKLGGDAEKTNLHIKWLLSGLKKSYIVQGSVYLVPLAAPSGQ